jgi:2-amino-4-hydroxy-6-hydroxymethyldihydropteridine diphosphokinase
MTTAYLGIGANIGNREANLRLALRWLSDACELVAVSSLYRSAALVLDGAEAGPDFRNAVARVETSLSAEDLLRAVKEVEHRIGRRPSPRWSARPIDIDILLCGDRVVESEELTVPHPGIAERNFVVLPLAELAPDITHPKLGLTIGEIAEAADYDGLEHLTGPEWVNSNNFDHGGSSKYTPEDDA